jgi:hypothetical protein
MKKFKFFVSFVLAVMFFVSAKPALAQAPTAFEELVNWAVQNGLRGEAVEFVNGAGNIVCAVHFSGPEPALRYLYSMATINYHAGNCIRVGQGAGTVSANGGQFWTARPLSSNAPGAPDRRSGTCQKTG